MRTWTCVLAVVAGTTAGVFGFEPEAAPLGGPKVESVEAPGGASFGEPQRRERVQQEMRNRIAMAEIKRAVEEGLPDDLDLSEEQRAQVRAVLEGHRDAMRAYLGEHEEELRELRAKAGTGGGGAMGGRFAERLSERRGGGRGAGRGGAATDGPAEMDQPAEMDGPRENVRQRPGNAAGARRGGGAGAGAEGGEGRPEPTPEQAAARERIAEIMSGAPKAEEAVKASLAVMSQAQREFVNGRIEARVEELRARVQERQGKREGAGGAGGEKLTPEQRERVKQRVGDRLGDRRGGQEDKPAPSMDGVEVPTPD